MQEVSANFPPIGHRAGRRRLFPNWATLSVASSLVSINTCQSRPSNAVYEITPAERNIYSPVIDPVGTILLTSRHDLTQLIPCCGRDGALGGEDSNNGDPVVTTPRS